MRAAYVLALVVMVFPSVAFAQQCTTDSRQVVDAIYQQMVGRSAGADNAPNAERLSSGETTVRDLVRDVALSPEHRRRFLGGNNPDPRAAVTQLYMHLLGRQPDPEGLRGHADRLASSGVEPVIDSLISSPEYQNAFGLETVPGSRVRYCGPGVTTPAPAAAPTTSTRFPGMDRDRNGTIARDEWNGSQQSFNLHDWNRDGVLSGDEMRAGVWRGARETADEDFDPFEPQVWTRDDFMRLDRNRDNRISSSEWYYNADAFRESDRDSNGSLSLGEFTAPVGDQRTSRFQNLDANRNGRVERGEWQGTFDAFELLDQNGDDILSRAEVRGEQGASPDSFASLDADGNRSIGLNEWRWSRRSFDRLDTNRDGRVSRQEFAASAPRPLTAEPR